MSAFIDVPLTATPNRSCSTTRFAPNYLVYHEIHKNCAHVTIRFALMIRWLEGRNSLGYRFQRSEIRMHYVVALWDSELCSMTFLGNVSVVHHEFFCSSLGYRRLFRFQWIWAVTNLLIVASEGTTSLDTLARLIGLCSLYVFYKTKKIDYRSIFCLLHMWLLLPRKRDTIDFRIRLIGCLKKDYSI